MGKVIIGFDEVGRGALAGPVCVGFVALSSEYPLSTFVHDKSSWSHLEEFRFVRDSKKLKESDREKADLLIKKYAIPNLVLSASAELIDLYGIAEILFSLFLLGVSYFETSGHTIKTVYLDGIMKLDKKTPLELINLLKKENSLKFNLVKLDASKCKTVIKGDDKFLSIALASNSAKVYRDDYMKKLSLKFPEFGWEENKGYGTEKHRKVIQQNPKNKYLRKTWLTKILVD
jgi:ribonuclease HII